MKVVDATYEIPDITKEEAERFLESKLNLQIATLDEKGEPIFNQYGFTMIKIK
jgi:hypothetical protein